MELLTTSLPPEYRLIENLGVFTTYTSIQLSQKGMLQSIFGNKRNELEDAYSHFMQNAPSGATVAFGVQVSTAVASGGNGIFMVMTITGTAAIHEVISNH